MSSQTNFIEDISMYTEIYIYPALITAFMKLCRLYNSVSDFFIDIYNSNENIKTIVDEVQYNVSSAYSFMINRKMAPRDPIWCCSVWLTPNDISITRYYNYNEEYSNFFTKYFCNDLFEFYTDCHSEYAMRYIQCIISYLTKKPEAIYPLLIIKTITPENVSFFSVRISKFPVVPFVYKKSTAKFISIEYTHPDMAEAIELKLEDGYYVYENELFTPAFVLRLLEYQSISYIFDNRYKIRILDSECSMIDFGFETHLLLTKDGYIMVTDNNIKTKNEDDDTDNEVAGYMGSSEEDDSDEEALFIDPSNNLGSLYTPFEFGYKI